MSLKSIIKFIIPLFLWRIIRRQFILYKHAKVATLLKEYVDACKAGKLESIEIQKKVYFSQNKKIIWQYWGQGYDKGSVPELVQICMASVDKYASDCTIIRLSDQNLSQYIDLPSVFYKKRDKIPLSQFSDILRCFLLAQYGGLWLDVSVLLTNKLPNWLFEQKFFIYQRDPNEQHKKYWENSFAYYWGWQKSFRVNVLIGVMYAEAKNKIVIDFCDILTQFWKEADKLPDYFLFQIMVDVYKENNDEWDVPIISDTIPHLLRQKINDNYPFLTVKEILNRTSIHSLSRKNSHAINRLKEILRLYEQ